MMDNISDARCAICYGTLAPGEHFIVVRMVDMTDERLVTPDNRSGVIHVRHLQNVFNPAMIDVQVTQNQYQAGFDMKVRVNL